MPPETPTIEPTVFTAGDTVKWKKSLSDYPAPTWVLTYSLRGPKKIDITAVADGTDHSIILTAAITAPYTPGDYVWQAYMTSGSERYLVSSGILTIKVNLAGMTSDQYDNRSHVKKVLDALEAAIERRVPQGQVRTSIDGQTSVEWDSFSELITLYNQYKAWYQEELTALRLKDTGINPKNIGIRLQRV